MLVASFIVHLVPIDRERSKFSEAHERKMLRANDLRIFDPVKKRSKWGARVRTRES
jgi:hypothetical protein